MRMSNQSNNLITILLRKATVFSILCPLLIIVLIPYSLYSFWRGFSENDWMSAYVFLIGFATATVLSILWVLDRLLVNFVRPVVLSAIELILISILFLWVGYSNRKLIIDASASSAQSFIVAYTIDDTLSEKTDYVFPFAEKITISDRNYVILSDTYRANKFSFPVVFQPPAIWTGYQTPGMIFDVPDNRFTDLDIYLASDEQVLSLSLDEERKITKAKGETAIKEFLARVKN